MLCIQSAVLRRTSRLIHKQSILASTACFSCVSPAKRGGSVVSASTAAAAAQKRRWKALRCCKQLAKSRLSMLVAATASAGCIAAGSPVSLVALTAVTTGTFLTSASANTFNQIIEEKSDALMRRTRLRPLPSRRISCSGAAVFGVASGISGLALLFAGTNVLTTSLAVANIFLYTCVYTPLKKVSPVNTEVGSVVGAIPPVMGWAAATGSIAGAAPAALGSILFLWQMPHFLSLAHLLRDDYAAGGYRMLSLNDSCGTKTSTSSLFYTSLLLPIPALTTAAGITSTMFAIDGLAANAFLLLKAYKFYRNPSDDSARAVFRTSLWHLPLLLSLFAFHKITDDAKAALDVPVLHQMGRSLCPHESLVLHHQGADYCPTNLDLDNAAAAAATAAANSAAHPQTST